MAAHRKEQVCSEGAWLRMAAKGHRIYLGASLSLDRIAVKIDRSKTDQQQPPCQTWVPSETRGSSGSAAQAVPGSPRNQTAVRALRRSPSMALCSSMRRVPSSLIAAVRSPDSAATPLIEPEKLSTTRATSVFMSRRPVSPAHGPAASVPEQNWIAAASIYHAFPDQLRREKGLTGNEVLVGGDQPGISSIFGFIV